MFCAPPPKLHQARAAMAAEPWHERIRANHNR
jgi:hypothetical protein